jgi:hypothetical protein
MLMGQSRTAEAKLAALKAYEADPYLATVRTTLWRLFQASLDLEDQAEATHWCEEGQRRFPQYHRFTECQIWLYALKGVTPDVPKAWQLLDEYVKLAPASSREYSQHYGQMLVAMAIARAGLKDSARHVAEHAQADPTIDGPRPAAVRCRPADHRQHRRGAACSAYVAANPQVKAMAKDETCGSGSEGDPRWRSLLGVPATS